MARTLRVARWRAMAGKSITLKALRAREDAQVPPRLGLRIVAVFVLIQLLLMAALLVFFPTAARAAPVRGEVSVSTRDGYARLVFTLSEETEADVRLNNGIRSSHSSTPSNSWSAGSQKARRATSARHGAIRTEPRCGSR